MKRKNGRRNLIILTVVAITLLGWATYAKFWQKKTAALTPTQQSLQQEVTKNADQANKDFTGTPSGGGASDTSGSTPVPTAGQPVSSASGVITLTTPSDGAKLADGSTIAGTAKVSTVQYRIKDNSYGVIASGPLSVVNGKYSGVVTLRTHGSTGTLEIFDFNANGVEENSLKINVTF